MQFDVFSSTIIYICCFLLSGFCAYCGKKYNKRTLVILAILLPALLATLRLNTGTDTATYRQFYNDVGNEPLAVSMYRITSGTMEPTIVLLSVFGNTLHLDASFIFAIYAIIATVFLYLTARNFSHSKVWIFYTAMLFFVFPESLNIMRQVAAVSVQAFTLSMITRNQRDDKKTSFILCAILTAFAASLHMSSLLLIPVLLTPFLIKKVHLRSLVLVLGTLAGISAVAYPKILDAVAQLGLLSPKHLGTLLETDGSIINIKFFACVLFAILFLVNYSRTKRRRDKSLAVTMLFGSIYSSIGFYSGYIGRLGNFFWVFIVIALCDMICQIFEQEKHRVAVCLCVAILYFVLYFSVLGFDAIVPYDVVLLS